MQKNLRLVEAHLIEDHVHVCLSVPPKYENSNAVGFIMGKRGIAIASHFGGTGRNLTYEVFGVREYFDSTVALDEAIVGTYIHSQEDEDNRYDQMKVIV